MFKHQLAEFLNVSFSAPVSKHKSQLLGTTGTLTPHVGSMRLRNSSCSDYEILCWKTTLVRNQKCTGQSTVTHVAPQLAHMTSL